MAAKDTNVNKKKTNNNYVVHSFLNNLSDNIDECSIKVRISRLWDTLNIRRNKELISTDMVLVDEKANCIHATIGRNIANVFKSILQEGKIYVISKFKVSSNKENFAVVENNPSMIEFYATTTVKEENNDENIIPRHIFEFVNLEDLKNRCGRDVLTDVIGVIIDINPIEEKTTVNGKVDMMTLQLKDKRGNMVKVTLWDEYATIFGQTLEKNMLAAPKPNIAIFTSTIVKIFREEVFISSSRSTKIYINIDIPEANELMQSFVNNNDVHTSENTNITHYAVQPKVDKVKTISELLSKATSKNNMDDVYYCVATVNNILVKNKWYYVSCPHCKKGVSATATNFICEFCNKNVDYPKIRFRLELDVKDSTDSTIFVLFDDIAEQVTQLKLGDLTSHLENENGGSSDLPVQLLNIIGSTHIFQIKMRSYFESRGRKSFTASKILKPVVKIEKEDKTDNLNASSSGSPKTNTPEMTQKRKRLRLQSDEESSDMKEKENLDKQILEDE